MLDVEELAAAESRGSRLKVVAPRADATTQASRLNDFCWTDNGSLAD